MPTFWRNDMKKFIVLAIVLLPFTVAHAVTVSKPAIGKAPIATDKTTTNPAAAQETAEKAAIAANKAAIINNKKPAAKMASATKSGR
jgi:hypothetical protein